MGAAGVRGGGAGRSLELLGMLWGATGNNPQPRAAHLPGMGDKVIHRNLDCFPFGDFFECLEDEFIVKGI